MEDRIHRATHTGLDVWGRVYERPRTNLYNLRADPFERGTDSPPYDWGNLIPAGF